jgi:hypothetical protein
MLEPGQTSPRGLLLEMVQSSPRGLLLEMEQSSMPGQSSLLVQLSPRLAEAKFPILRSVLPYHRMSKRLLRL